MARPMTPQANVIERVALGKLSQLGQGGQGIVYRAAGLDVAFSTPMVYKEYRQSVRYGINGTALSAMPELLAHLSPEDRHRLLAITSWPAAVVTEQGTLVGFVMTSIPDRFYIALNTAAGSVRAPAELQHLLNDPAFIQQRGIRVTERDRYGLIRVVAAGLTFLHSQNICVGDLSPKNILFSLGQQPAVYFIDCDAMRVAGQSVSTQLETPGWEVPRGEELATFQTDSYKLGLLALRLLVGDQHARDVRRLPVAVPYDVRSLIMDALSRPSGSRPTPAAWDFALAKAVELAPDQPTPVSTNSPAPAVALVMQRVPPPPNAVAPAAPPIGGNPRAVVLAVLSVIVVVLAVVTVVVVKNTGSDPAPETGAYTYTTSELSPTPTTTRTPTSPPPTTPERREFPSGAVMGPDTYGKVCDAGYRLTNMTGWATEAVRGSTETSCDFTDNVLSAYWRKYLRPDMESRVVDVPGGRGLSCQTVPGATCRGDLFVMTCGVWLDDSWITCEGGNNARVYLY